MISKDIDVNGFNVRTHLWMRDEKLPTILSVHGLGGTGLNIIEIAELLTKYNVISIDLPGHGGSEQLKESFTMKAVADWIDATMEKIGFTSFHMIGHSYGADVAIHFAYHYHSRVKRLILLDGGYYNKSLQYDLIKQFAKEGVWPCNPIDSLEKECAYYKDDFDNFSFNSMEEYLEVEVENYSRMSEYLILALKALMIEENEGVRFVANGESATKAIRAMYNDLSALRLSELKVRTLLLVSSKPCHYKVLREKLLNAIKLSHYFEYEIVDDASHFLHWDNPLQIAQRINQFLGEDLTSM